MKEKIRRDDTPAQRLYEARTRLNLSQSDLARALGVTRVMIVKWEGTGPDSLRDPKLSTIHRIAYALDISPAWLAFGDA